MIKKLILSIALCAVVFADVTPTEAITKGTVSAELRGFYMQRTFDDVVPDTDALTAGGVLSYTTGEYKGITAVASYFGSYKVSDTFSREEGIGTSNLQSDGSDIGFIGEAYLQYSNESLRLRYGKQRLSTPLANNHDLRMLPSSYDTVQAQYTVANTMVELDYIKTYTGFVSKANGFDDKDEKWGSDGIGSIYVKSSLIPRTKLNVQYIKAISDTDNQGNLIKIRDYRYADVNFNLDSETKTYVKMQAGGNEYTVATNSLLYGAKIGTTINTVDLALLANVISGNEFKAIEAGPMYSDWQQGYGNYEPSTAFGGQVTIHPYDNVYFKVGFVDVSADDNLHRDDFTEVNIDTQWAIDKMNKLRFRYSAKNQAEDATREDRNDLRVIYYLSF